MNDTLPTYFVIELAIAILLALASLILVFMCLAAAYFGSGWAK